MILSKETWNYIVEKQQVLDEAFLKKARFYPTIRHREFALYDEVSEFINQFGETFKWWKHKENDQAKMLDEYIDILHFAAGIAIAEKTYDKWHDQMAGMRKDFAKGWFKKTMLENLEELRFERSVFLCVVHATWLLETLGVSDSDIRKAYDLKNRENFKRIEAGY